MSSGKEIPRIKTKIQIYNKSKTETELYLYGDITQSSWWHSNNEDIITSKKVREILEKIKTENINVHLNSSGGDVFESIAIYNLLKQHSSTINIYIDGMAASGASIIAMAGNKIYMPTNTMMMIHKAWTYTAGTAEELRKTAEDLDKINTSVKSSYLDRFIGTDLELEQLLSDETYLTADECKTLGLCDEILEEVKKEPNHEETKNSILNKYKKNKTTTMKDEKESSFFNVENSILNKFRSDINEIENAK